MTNDHDVPDDGERPIPNEAIGLGDARDVDAMRTAGTDWVFEIDQAMSGAGTWFTSRLLRLFTQADGINQAKLGTAFPDEFAAFTRWQNSTGEFEHLAK